MHFLLDLVMLRLHDLRQNRCEILLALNAGRNIVYNSLQPICAVNLTTGLLRQLFELVSPLILCKPFIKSPSSFMIPAVAALSSALA